MLYRRLIVGAFPAGHMPTVAEYDGVRARIVDQLVTLHQSARLKDLDAELATLDRERADFLDDPAGYLDHSSQEPLPDQTRRSEPAAGRATPEDQAADAQAAFESPRTEARHDDGPPPAHQQAGMSVAVSPKGHTVTARPSILKMATVAAVVSGLTMWAAAEVFGFGNACGVVIRRCYDSGWVMITRASRAAPFAHGLGARPNTLTVMFSPTPDGAVAYPVEFRWGEKQPGNPVSVRVNAESVILDMWDGAPVRATFDGRTGGWTSYDRGYFRVMARL